MSRLLTALTVGLLTLSAEAHTPLASSAPAEGASVPTPVEALVLEFGDPVRLTALSLADTGGTAKTLGEIPSAIAAKFTIAVRQELPPGDYVATWRAVGADTHVISGAIHFKVAAPSAH
jgi:methionine-rich copper-binding protein CopC